MDIISDTYNNENVYIVKPVTNEKNELVIRRYYYKNLNEKINAYASSFKVPENVIEIGSLAFSKCEQLHEIELPDSIKIIRDCAFWECINLKFINLPSSLKRIAKYSFCKCKSLTEINIPNNITCIASHAFAESGLNGLVRDTFFS